MSITAPNFALEAENLAAAMVEIRRRIHRHPELGFQEWETAGLIARKLEDLNLEVRTGVGKTGVIGLIRGAQPGPTIALRADMDALPLDEDTGLEFASVNPGVMHACGHDAHVAMVIGAAALLAGKREQLAGNIKLLFQPSEETLPGGALAMIEDGALDDPRVDAVVGLHVNPHLPAGFIGLKEGAVMASPDMFRVTIHGKGGHGAAPHQTVDAVVVAAQAVLALQTIASRRVDPLVPVVVTVGAIKGGTKGNIIADTVEMLGTVRTIHPDLRDAIPGMISDLLKGITSAHGASFEFDYQQGYPPLQNDQDMVNLLWEASRRVAGPRRVFKMVQPSMGGEDFSYFAQKVPAVYFYLGAAKEGLQDYPWHHSHFDLAENALPTGAAVMAQAVWMYLLAATESSGGSRQ